MTESEILHAIPGAQSLLDIFGRWPSFHDAEVISLELNRSADSELKVHTFAMTAVTDSRGYYVTEKHTVVTFALKHIYELSLVGFSPQNVISCLTIEKRENGYRLELGGCYGLEGSISAMELTLACELGLPPGSIYET